MEYWKKKRKIRLIWLIFRKTFKSRKLLFPYFNVSTVTRFKAWTRNIVTIQQVDCKIVLLIRLKLLFATKWRYRTRCNVMIKNCFFDSYLTKPMLLQNSEKNCYFRCLLSRHQSRLGKQAKILFMTILGNSTSGILTVICWWWLLKSAFRHFLEPFFRREPASVRETKYSRTSI